ncbi:division/cell wall cluster transcriptional repressor MraZ [Halarsenatibacter silvermanii]|uniref:Transcriptional regulator MraZ n=1 Tax=Halarsenatibacter silvermanii TaxID=321763 RepID=A0A1G9JNE5_9FIRM|nr:division/cell wall cluster transcriptional repressor MraZ [Halarsenatibacter silvermanii]SDL39117.1 MraZ protein [Halarsenatibacter silvermanii]
MFMGEYHHKLDSKGRVIMPAQFREILDDSFVITRGLDNCLFLYPPPEWKKLEEKLNSLPLTKKDARTFTRFFLSGASECSFDSQGRISLPQNLRNYANLDEDIVIAGIGRRIELWASDRWEDFLQDAEESHEDIAATLEGLEI